ncbi:MAG: protease complex subunit PrcB family protein [Planctomycetes bacterium]|nr:protease complex subunit PrcB family protein [Planctomycetota bacterium]
MTTVLRAAHTALRGERNVVIRNADDWQELWREHGSVQLTTADVPAIDFERRMVVGVVLGTCATGGHSVEIRRIEPREGRLRVIAHHQRPAEGSIQTMVLTKPLHLVAVDRTDAEVEFVWE